jgi:Mg-chelatase subunit ChlD
MGGSDRKPLADTPVTNKISRRYNNRLGAVYSALHSFWSARHAAMTTAQQATSVRRDGYSIILFNHSTSNVVTNDFTSSPDQLLDAVLDYGPSGFTDFTDALNAAQTLMEQHFSSDRYD